tara:strand:+ start:14937 stop:16598 length:1662 start_codon:yes stop_codon:yes gene_type:complete
MALSTPISQNLRGTLSGVLSGESVRYIQSGRVVDLGSNFTDNFATITDLSPEGNDGTLKSGRLVHLDGVSEKITIGDISGFSGVTRVLRIDAKIRSASEQTIYCQASNAREDGVVISAGQVDNWITASFDMSAYAIGSANNVVLGWATTGGYTAADWAEYTIIGDNGASTAEVVIAHGYCNISSDTSAAGLDDLTIFDASGNSFNGALTGSDGATAEGSIVPQISGMNYNQYRFFNASDTTVALSSVTLSGDFTVTGSFLLDAGRTASRVIAGGATVERIRIAFSTGALSITFFGGASVTFSTLVVPFGDGVVRDYTITRTGSAITATISGIGSEEVTSTPTIDLTFVEIGGLGGIFEFGGLIFNTDFNSQAAYLGYGLTPWEDTIGSNNGTEGGAFSDILCPESDASSIVDALGNAISDPRTNTKVLNLVGDGDSIQVPANATLDTTKTVVVWIWHDATTKTVVDLGTPTVGTTTTDLTSSGFTGVLYFVDGVSGTTLSAGWNYCTVVSTAALATDGVDQLQKSSHLICYTQEFVAADALINFNATKSQYGL